MFIEGREGRGKTEAVKAWQAAHRGEARGATAPALGRKQDFLRRLAMGLGAAECANVTALQGWVETVLTRSGLMLVIDEAHFMLNHRAQGGRPLLLDWLDEALSDRGVPVALVATPQFASDLKRAHDRTGWNAEQFKRRFIRRWTVLPVETDADDMAALAERLLPGVSAEWRTRAVAGVKPLGRDVSGLGDLAAEASFQAGRAGRARVGDRDCEAALGVVIANENALDASLLAKGPAGVQPKAARPSRTKVAEATQTPCAPSASRARSVVPQDFRPAIGAGRPRAEALVA